MADHMSRAEMEAVIKSGGTVYHEGKLYASVAALPSPGELEGVEGLKTEEAELEARLKATKERRAAAERSAADAEKAQAAAAKKAAADEADEDDEKAPAKKSAHK
jgi:membrane protein involved in colicin uptake